MAVHPQGRRGAGLIILGFGLFFLFQLELTWLLQAPPDKRREDADEGKRDAEPGDRVLQVCSAG